MIRSARGKVAVAAALLALVLTGCTADDQPRDQAPESPAATAGADVDVAEPGSSATAYPVPADAEAVELPGLGTLASGQWTFTLNGLRRTSDEGALLTGTLTSLGPTVFTGLEEAGFANRENAAGKLDSTREFSAVSLSVQGDPAVYQPMRDESGACVCYQGVTEIEPNTPVAVYVYVTAPADATTASVTIAGLGTLEGVELSA